MEHLLIIILTVGFYFLPTIIAMIRKHHNMAALGVTNLLLGWTGLAWIIAFIWAFTTQKETQVIINNTASK